MSDIPASPPRPPGPGPAPGPGPGSAPAAGPGPGPAPRPPGPPPAAPKRTGRRLVVVAVVTVFVLALGGLGGFALGGGFSDPVGRPTTCRGPGRCIPTLNSNDVIEAVKGQGHTCTEESDWVCELAIGDSEFELRMTTSVDAPLIGALLVTVGYPEGERPGKAVRSYLTWMASLAYGNDPVTTAEVTTWLERQLDAGEDGKLLVGSFEYSLTAFRPGSVRFEFRGIVGS
jgi:hypothetical protein